jgi:hypothetical protein
MVAGSSAVSHVLDRFADKTIACNHYALSKLGLDKGRCSLKVHEYALLCAPYQLGFNRSVFLASLSPRELNLFLPLKNMIAGLSMEFALPGYRVPFKLFIRSSLTEVGRMRGRDDVGLFVVDYKSTPEDLVSILGTYLESQERLNAQYEDYGRTAILLSADASKRIGYNQYAVINDKIGDRRIQIHSISSKSIEHMEASSSYERSIGTTVSYQIFFIKYRVTVQGRIESTSRLQNGIVKTKSKLDFNPELVEILDDYWFRHGNTDKPLLLSRAMKGV